VSTNPPPQRNPASVEDIPEAIRNVSPTPKVKSPQVIVSGQAGQPKFKGVLIAGGLGIAGLALFAGWWQQSQLASNSNSGAINTVRNSQSTTGAKPDQVLGHFAYAVAPQSALEIVLPGDAILLRKPAAEAFRAMSAAAARDGVSLALISGFRSLDDQNHLFFEVKKERGQTAKERAEVSAPPGYSEHHTGYALDVGDTQAPAANLNPSFEETAAFQWLQKHAAEFSFELSFPKNNAQEVTYEPWHWRFVGDRNSLETFYKARSTK
jgi:zinc D-Ala-D-Ala carboxypeptidase